MFLDVYGEANVTNHKTNDRCLIKYEGYSFFSGQSKRFYGAVTDGSRNGAVSEHGTTKYIACHCQITFSGRGRWLQATKKINPST